MRYTLSAFFTGLTLSLSAFSVLRAQSVSPPRLSGLSGVGIVDTGQRVTLSPLFASGTSPSPYQYQWRKNGADLLGASAATYVIEAATIGDSGNYSVAVSNAGGTSVTGGELTVRPGGPIVFTTQPRAQTVQVGQPAFFSFFATGSFPRTYQWRKDGNAIAGATQLTLSLSAVTTADAASYTVAVTNPEGTTTSAAAALTVNAATPLVFFNGSPADLTITHGDAGTLFASISSGSSPVTYQWSKNGSPLTGATAAQLNFAAAQPADGGKYSVVATNPAGTATSREATLTIRAATPVAFSSQPLAQSVFQGQSASFFVTLSAGSQPITYQWIKDGAPLAGATLSGLRLDPVKLSDAGSYTLVATNAAGSVASAAAQLTVTPAEPPSITRQPVGATVPYYQQFNIFAEVRGTPPLRLTWFRGDTPVQSDRTDYSAYNATSEHTGDYTLVVSNVAGSATSQIARIVVTPPAAPVITKEPASIQISAGMAASFQVEFTAVGTGYVTSQWLKDGRAIPGADSRTNQNYLQGYFINNVAPSDAGEYSVILTGVGGAVTSKPARLTVLSAVPPSIDFWPRDEYTNVGSSNVQFNVRPTGGSTPLAIQWYREGAPIAGATAETYYLPGRITEADFGRYSVTISNGGGLIASPDFFLRPYSSSQTPPWVAAEQFGSIVYFLVANPHRIERYDLAGERWLPSVALPGLPTALLPTAEGVYVAYGRVLTRRSLDLTTETPITNAIYDIVALFAIDQYLYYTTSSNASGNGAITNSLHRSTLEAGPSTAVVVHAAAFAASRRQLAGFSYGGGSPRLFPVDAQGRLGTPTYHYALERFPAGARAMLFPGEEFVANAAGSVFRLSDMSYAASLGEALDDLVFLTGRTPVVLRGLTLQTLDPITFFRTGTVTLPFRGWRAFSNGTNTFAFGAPVNVTGPTFQVAKVASTTFTKPTPVAPVIGANDRYSIDEAFLGEDGVVHVFTRSRRAVVRWSASSRAFLTPVPLRGAPQISSQTFPAKRALFSYGDGVVTELALRAGDTVETQVGTVTNLPLALTDLGSQIMINATPMSYPSVVMRLVLDQSGKIASAFTSDQPDGRRGLGWEPARRRFFSGPSTRFDAGTLFYETLLADGTVNGASGSVNNVALPLRFSADSAFIATGNGRVLNGNLTQVGVLANDIQDAAWLTGDFYTTRLLNGETQVQRWSRTTYLQTGATTVRGVPVRLFRLSDTQLVVVTNTQGFPAFTLLNADLSVAGNSAPPTGPDFGGVYFGQIVSRFTGAAEGDIALYVRPDRTAVLLAIGSDRAAATFTVNIDGSFSALAADVVFGTRRIFTGSINANGALSGGIEGTGSNFTGTKTAGSTAACYYFAPLLNSSSGGLHTIVGADGRAFTLARNTETADGGFSALDAAGRVIVPLRNNATLTVLLNSATGSVTASADRDSFATSQFSGVRDDVPHTDRLANISTRGRAGAGDDVMIAGFVLSGTAPRSVLIRAIGPTLSGFGVPGTLGDPRLALYRGDTKLSENDNWSTSPAATDVAATTTRVGGFTLASGSADAALLLTLEPGAYTAQVSAAPGSASGNALVEVYDSALNAAPGASEPRLINIATRGRLAAAGDTFIAGIVVTGNAPKRVLIRAIGPGLTAFGVPGALADPTLVLTGPTPAGPATIARNDDWSIPDTRDGATLAELTAATVTVGAFALPPGSKDACLLLTLSPGNYTAQVLAKGSPTGAALIEVYEVPN